jgi:hypothetical protein
MAQGGIAQLVEHRLCKAIVSGSTPLTSRHEIQGRKSLWGIPWHSEAMKDVVTNEMLRGAGNKL